MKLLNLKSLYFTLIFFAGSAEFIIASEGKSILSWGNLYFYIAIPLLVALIAAFFVVRNIARNFRRKPEKEKIQKIYMPWEDHYSVNVKELDEQHKKLVSIINELHNAMEEGKGRNVMASILNSMINYVSLHFTAEEKYMTSFNYPDYRKHKERHKKFVKKALEFQNNFNEGKLGLSIEVMCFLKTWLANHILITDKEYSSFFNEKGLK